MIFLGPIDGVSTWLQKRDLEQPYAVGLVILSASPFLIRLENKVRCPAWAVPGSNRGRAAWNSSQFWHNRMQNIFHTRTCDQTISFKNASWPENRPSSRLWRLWRLLSGQIVSLLGVPLRLIMQVFFSLWNLWSLDGRCFTLLVYPVTFDPVF